MSRDYDGVVGESPEAVAQFISSDQKIRAGTCPNNCGLLVPESHWGQSCPACGFICNTLPDQQTRN